MKNIYFFVGPCETEWTECGNSGRNPGIIIIREIFFYLTQIFKLLSIINYQMSYTNYKFESSNNVGDKEKHEKHKKCALELIKEDFKCRSSVVIKFENFCLTTIIHYYNHRNFVKQ